MASNIFEFPGGSSDFSQKGGNGGGGDQMEARVAKLESHVEHMRADLADLKADAKTISKDIIDLKLAAQASSTGIAQIKEHMVTKGQLATYALMTIIAILGGGWWIIQQYLSPILKAIPK